MKDDRKDDRKDEVGAPPPDKPDTLDAPPLETLTQLQGLTLAPERPLIVSDADGVLLQFVERFEHFLSERALWLDMSSFALGGNIKHRDTNRPWPQERMSELIDDFFLHETDKIAPVPHAAQALQELSQRAQIVVLSNLPLRDRERRAANLAAHGMEYPVVAGTGPKGPAVGWLQQQMDAPVFFLDDIHYHIDSVAQHAPTTRCVQFLVHEGFRKFATETKSADTHVHDWKTAHSWLQQALTQSGY